MNLMSVITVSRPQQRPRYFLKTWERLIDSWFKTVEAKVSKVACCERSAPRPRREATEGSSGPLQGRGGRGAGEGSPSVWSRASTASQPRHDGRARPAMIISHRRRTQFKRTAPRGTGLTGRRQSRSDSLARASLRSPQTRKEREGRKEGGQGELIS